MSANPETPEPAGYAWPGADEPELGATWSRVARHVSRAGVRTVGVLPVVGGAHWWSAFISRGVPTLDLRPALERLAEAMVGFVGGTVGFIGGWQGWGTNERTQDGRQALRIRGVRPQVVEIVPPPCSSSSDAFVVLRRSLASLPAEVGRVLVDLGGYVPVGRVPQAATLVDGVLAAVAARRTRQDWVAHLKDHVPPEKSLGAILIG